MRLSLVPRFEETIAGSRRALRDGRVTSVGLVNRCFSAMEKWESTVNAWVVVDHMSAIEQARELDGELRSGMVRGPLHGIPFGIKDIIDVKGLPTRAGTQGTPDVRMTRDSDVVDWLRSHGAVILGKTVTTPYAFTDPPPTRNPWDLSRTPGGSSSGSAAAVATGMCMGAVGTQTVGSLTRPASFCGVSSWKPDNKSSPSSRDRIVALAPSFDTVGFMARSVRDLALIARCHSACRTSGQSPRRFKSFIGGGLVRLVALRGDYIESRIDPTMRLAMDRAVSVFKSAGLIVANRDLPAWFDEVPATLRTMVATEAALVHQSQFARRPGDYPAKIAELIREGQRVLATDFIEAHQLRTRGEALFAHDVDMIDILILPAATGPAPGPETTGNAVFNAPWNLFNVPTVSFPIGLSPDGLPLAIQLVGDGGGIDGLLFAVALECERLIQAQLKSERG